MPNSHHNIQCKCGQIRGLLTSTTPSNRCVCYCEDCQAFARHLQAQGTLVLTPAELGAAKSSTR